MSRCNREGSRTSPLAPGPCGAALQEALQRLSQDPLTTYFTMQRQFGDVVCLDASPHPIYLLSHPDAVQHVLRDHAQNYRKGVFFQTIAALQGQGLLTSEADLWRQQRRLLQPTFQPQQLAAFASILAEEIQGIVQGWQQAACTGASVNVSAWMHRLMFRLMGRAVLGLPAEFLDELGRQLQTLGAQLMPHLSMPLPLDSASSPESPMSGSFRRAIAAYQEIAQQILTMRRRVLQDGPTTDILAALLQAQGSDSSISDQQIRDEIITFIGAGTETSAQALSWALYLLALHPEVGQCVQAEIASVGERRLLHPADLRGLPYSLMVLEEALRLYPPAALLPRQANAAAMASGYTIPQDSIVMLSPYVTHRHPDFWTVPEVFQPQRFAPEQIASQHRFAYFPFGAGPRLCIGKPFALLEMHLALSTLMQAYTFRLTSTQPVVPELSATLRPRGGLWLTVHGVPAKGGGIAPAPSPQNRT